MYSNLFDDFDLDVQKVVVNDEANCTFSSWAGSAGCPPYMRTQTCNCATLSCDMICEMRADN